MRNLLFLVESNSNWMGGVYYIRNIIFALRQVDGIDEKYKIYVLLDEDVEYVFEDMIISQEITKIHRKRKKKLKRIVNKLVKSAGEKLFHLEFIPDLGKIIIKYKIDQIYPMNHPNSFWFKKGICWIPDFQHIYYPQFFDIGEINRRNQTFELLAKKHRKIVLSSQSAYSDYKELFPLYDRDVYVVPFISAIPKSILEEDTILQVQKKYGIDDKYFMVSNQFWQHKDHMTVFRAIDRIKKVYNRDILVVCTGLISDYRNPEYGDFLNRYIKENNLAKNIKIVGFISRTDQIQLMKGCLAVIQPSLFEGWGTVVEDAKTLGKPVVMSDIQVHYEQRIEGNIIFGRGNFKELATILIEIADEQSERVFEYSYIQTAKKYGKLFYDMLEA